MRTTTAWHRMSRRRLTMLIVGITAGLATCLSACGTASSEDATDTTNTPSAGSPSADGGGYPLTVRTRYGKVTIDKAPERVVALSVTEADSLISLGVRPVAVAADPDTLQTGYPWMVDSIKDISDAGLSSPSGDLHLEAIAATHPDLLIAQTWQVKDRATYERLSKIAPTVLPDSDAVNVDWDRRLLSTAAAVDKTARAQHLISSIRAEFAKVGHEVPGISTKTYQFVRADPHSFGFGNGSVLELFGLKPAANQDNTQNGPGVAKENTAELDADLLGIWIPTEQRRKALDNDPLFQGLPAVKHGTVFYADLAVADAANSPAPMALRWLRDKLAPTIRALG